MATLCDLSSPCTHDMHAAACLWARRVHYPDGSHASMLSQPPQPHAALMRSSPAATGSAADPPPGQQCLQTPQQLHSPPSYPTLITQCDVGSGAVSPFSSPQQQQQQQQQQQHEGQQGQTAQLGRRTTAPEAVEHDLTPQVGVAFSPAACAPG